MWQCKHVVEVRDWKQFQLSGFSPSFLSCSLTFRTVAVAATVVQEPLKAATRAPLAMPAKDFRPAVDDLLHHFQVASRDSMRREKRLTVLAKDVGQFRLVIAWLRRLPMPDKQD